MGGRVRRYTLVEASALIGPLGRLIEDLRHARRTLAERERAEERSTAAGANGGGDDDAAEFARAALVVSRGMAQIERWGVVVRDLDSGICDFLAERDGRDVWLCWRVGEERIAWWHELEAGFAGRQPLDEASAAS
jgi:hypothetical protein